MGKGGFYPPLSLSLNGPYLLQHVHGVPAALHAGGEAGRGRGIVILCCLREELGHRYLIRHPLTGRERGEGGGDEKKCPKGSAMKLQKDKSMKE